MLTRDELFSRVTFLTGVLCMLILEKKSADEQNNYEFIEDPDKTLYLDILWVAVSL